MNYINVAYHLIASYDTVDNLMGISMVLFPTMVVVGIIGYVCDKFAALKHGA